MPTKHKKTSFDKLKDKWYAKLKKSGFDDIERSAMYLKRDTAYYSQHPHDGQWQEKAAYFQMATNFLEEYKFENRIDQIVWEYHSNGMSMREIAIALKSAKVKMTKDKAFAIIKRLKVKMFDMYMVSTKEYHE